MAIKLPSHLHRARSGILHFRIAIPPDLRQHFKTGEIYRSLRTASVREAAQAAQPLSQAPKRAFQQLGNETMFSQKKPPTGPSDGSEWGLIPEISFDDFMRPKLTLIPEPGDTPEDRIQAQAEFLRAAGSAGAGSQPGAGTQAPTKHSPLFSELIKDYERDRLAAKRWTPTTQKENLAIYKLCMDIIGDIPISEIGEEQALTYLETMQKLPANMNKMPADAGKTIKEIVALNPALMATRTINKSHERISSLFKFATLKPKYDLLYNPFGGRSTGRK
jgi:hypothetical protein